MVPLPICASGENGEDRVNEAEFIAALRTLPLHPGARGLQDDAAVIEPGSDRLVVTHDTMVEAVHFTSDADLADVAWKLVATNLSDLAAKGAEPDGVLLSYTLGRDDERFLEGLGDALRTFDVTLLGGDTTSPGGARSFGLTAIGRGACEKVPSRSGARAGDAVWLCGRLGWAMLGFEGKGGEFAQALLRPVPLIEEGMALASRVTAMMDVSDGLLLDASRMALASGVTLDLHTTHIPVADSARMLECLTWGDDYALLFTCDPKISLPVGASQIGFVLPAGAHAVLVDGVPPPAATKLGYQHG
jgi:thiamine-monophosphate kinase